MKPLALHSEARSELDAAMSWYEKSQKGVGLELHAEVADVFDRIKQNPDIGTPYQSTEYRFIRTKRFPYLIYYLELEETIWVAAITHAHRRPGYWQNWIAE